MGIYDEEYYRDMQEDRPDDDWDDRDDWDNRQEENNGNEYCQNCGRLIHQNNKSIDGVMCQACQGDGCRRLIIFDWLTGGRFFGLF